jgi:hypothetical protein
MATFTEAPATASAQSLSDSDGTRTATLAGASTSSTVRPDPNRSATVAAGATTDTVRPRPERPGHAAGGATVDLDRPRPPRFSDHAESTDVSGILIPGAFRPVDVTVVDPDGNPLPEVDWVLSTGVFPTAARISDDGRGDLPCLATTYTAFQGIASREGGPDGVKYTWFNPATDEDGNRLQEPIGPLDDEAEIVLEPVQIKGLYVGAGTDFGGMLG